jgi:hypothetical protein
VSADFGSEVVAKVGRGLAEQNWRCFRAGDSLRAVLTIVPSKSFWDQSEARYPGEAPSARATRRNEQAGICVSGQQQRVCERDDRRRVDNDPIQRRFSVLMTAGSESVAGVQSDCVANLPPAAVLMQRFDTLQRLEEIQATGKAPCQAGPRADPERSSQRGTIVVAFHQK